MTKNKIWKMLLTIFFVGFLTACGDDDNPITGVDNNPFTGVDNNILSFSLSLGENTWQAAIVDDKVILSAPQGTELNGATAHYTISEQASITPDPAGISAWNEEQQLTVTSYNGTSRTYKYTVRHTDVSEAASFVLNSQAEVDAFAKSNITIIEGSISIATAQKAEDPVKNLDGLSALTEVLDDINIGGYYQGENLNGLANLKKAGNLTITSRNTDNETLTDITLPSLVSVRKNLTISESKYYKKIAFPHLETVSGNFTVNASAMEQFNVNSLKRVDGDNGFTIIGGVMTQLELPALEVVNKSLYIRGEKSTNELLTINLPLLTTCALLSIENAVKLENLKIPVLKNLTTGLTLSGCSVFSDESLKNTLNNIESIAGTLALNGTGVFDLNLQGKKVGKVQIGADDSTKEFIITGDEPFGSITFTSKNMNPPTLKGFTTVEDYNLGTNIESNLIIKDVKRINGKLWVSYPSMGTATNILHDIHLPTLEYVGNIDISSLGVDVVSDELDAPNLQTIGSGGIYLNVHNEQPDFSFIKMKNIEKIEGQLYIKARSSNKSQINKLDIKEIFPKLKELTNVYIWGFPKLYDYSSFKEFIDNGMITTWKVTYCGYKPTLQQMKDSPTGDFTNN
ncbi:hypothetical protein [Bacteroides faecium]|uniref:Receptor L domain protein n=1 Tax=Bacteroides faecium TaxID=2715212 RepID=A0A6H0KV42_9BACE|nr:hypothetical protein [Bacteroides faecium]QIU97310.1 hypothetical protein BacF7301_25530 [Bacteroides faecium]